MCEINYDDDDDDEANIQNNFCFHNKMKFSEENPS